MQMSLAQGISKKISELKLGVESGESLDSEYEDVLEQVEQYLLGMTDVDPSCLRSGDMAAQLSVLSVKDLQALETIVFDSVDIWTFWRKTATLNARKK